MLWPLESPVNRASGDDNKVKHLILNHVTSIVVQLWSKVVKGGLNQAGVEILGWPSQSPMNTIFVIMCYVLA